MDPVLQRGQEKGRGQPGLGSRGGGGGHGARPSVSDKKVLIQPQVAAMPSSSPLHLGDAAGTKATFSSMASQGLLHHPFAFRDIIPAVLPHQFGCYHS